MNIGIVIFIALVFLGILGFILTRILGSSLILFLGYIIVGLLAIQIGVVTFHFYQNSVELLSERDNVTPTELVNGVIKEFEKYAMEVWKDASPNEREALLALCLVEIWITVMLPVISFVSSLSGEKKKDRMLKTVVHKLKRQEA